MKRHKILSKSTPSPISYQYNPRQEELTTGLNPTGIWDSNKDCINLSIHQHQCLCRHILQQGQASVCINSHPINSKKKKNISRKSTNSQASVTNTQSCVRDVVICKFGGEFHSYTQCKMLSNIQRMNRTGGCC